ncbi:MAG: hypothetical protein A3E83_04385 [Gammaproteobacteria bacterium RIFCSPHIGHO2_12_FULL_41_20]|nr:MAG: hypothetical protein A3E83_04385 [Gammaproteobacteria bacterium RIFCSPHIGHO2_12_FULL_41_20]
MDTQNNKLISIIAIIITLALPIDTMASSLGAYGRAICKSAGFFCLRVAHGESWETLWPDPEERHIVMSINRLSIPLFPGIKIAVPDNLTGMSLIDFSPFPERIDPPGEKLILFNPRLLAWAAYLPDGQLLRWGPASGGAGWCPDIQQSCRTKIGTFRIYSMGSVDCKSTKFPIPKGGAPMPYCMYFYGGQALHGSPNNLPGFNASHGCVRLLVDDAEWLRNDFIAKPSKGYHATKVIVQSYAADDVQEQQDDGT